MGNKTTTKRVGTVGCDDDMVTLWSILLAAFKELKTIDVQRFLHMSPSKTFSGFSETSPHNNYNHTILQQ